MTDLSVIIPIYNTPEEELRRCFSSLSGLSGFTWEAVLIDDGSQPETGAFCKAYAEADPTFRYFRKENGGVSSARNMGLDMARGRCVTFVDADDELIAQAITAPLLEHSLVLFDIELDGKPWPALNVPEGPVTPWQLHLGLTASKGLNSPCAKLFKKSVIDQHSLRFNTDFVTAEDWSFVWDYCSHIDSAVYCAQCSYRYIRDCGSSSGRLRKFPDKMLSNLMAVYDKKAALLPALYPNENTAAALNKAAAMSAEDLFNAAAELYLMKLLTVERKALLRAFARKLLKQHRLPKKALLKAWVSGYCWAALPPLALARRQYLK